MTDREIIRLRLHNQHLNCQELDSPKDLGRWMGALQAQDYNMVKWAMGIRLPGSTRKTIETAISRSEIIRTHLLRPTWHLVCADDLRWMLELTAPRIKTVIRSQHKQLELTKEIIAKSNSVISEALVKNSQLTRNDLVTELEHTGFINKNNLVSHLLLRAELDGLICSGPSRGKEYTYALLDGRVPESTEFTKDKALSKLAQTYFSSHGPATLEDFTWWSGLTKTSARKGLKMISADFKAEEIASETYWYDDSHSFSGDPESAHLLPAYDEFIISYKNREMVIRGDVDRKKAISNNGIFRPVIVVNGQVIGIWKRLVKKERVIVETNFFHKPVNQTLHLVEEAAGKYAAFLDKKLEITHQAQT